jgi:hypothetical protein
MVHVVTYDLREPNVTPENYELIIGGIKTNYPTWAHIEKSVWLVDTVSDAGTVRDTLMAYIHEGDALFVARLTGNWASYGLSTEIVEWLKNRTF